jgi:predicted PurR-regulated permease PerM
MARSMYIKKIAKKDEDVQASLTAGVTIDHVFSLTIALIGGVIWSMYGFQYVFLLGILIAILEFIAASFVRVPPSGLRAADEVPVPIAAGDEV